MWHLNMGQIFIKNAIKDYLYVNSLIWKCPMQTNVECIKMKVTASCISWWAYTVHLDVTLCFSSCIYSFMERMELTWTLFKSLNKLYNGELFETSGFHLPFDPLRPVCGVCALCHIVQHFQVHVHHTFHPWESRQAQWLRQSTGPMNNSDLGNRSGHSPLLKNLTAGHGRIMMSCVMYFVMVDLYKY